MSKLTSAERNKLPASAFGDPKSRKFPEEDRAHAVRAKGRAKQQLNRGALSQHAYDFDRLEGQSKASKVTASSTMDAATLRDEIRNFLNTMKDHGTEIDSGAGMGEADLWVKVGGIEWFITIKKSNAQLAREQGR